MSQQTHMPGRRLPVILGDDRSTFLKTCTVSDFPEEQLLVAVFPGVPTAAELFLLPSKNQSESKKKSEDELEQVSAIIVSALNQNLVEFELKPGVRVIVYNTQLTLAPLVDSNPRHSSSAMLMLLSVVFLGLAVFLIYKFKRKIPWINVYAEVNQEKEQEMIGSVGQGDSTPKITLSEFSTSKELMDKELEARVKTDNQAGSDTKLTVEDLFKPEFKVHDPEAKWVNDSEVIYRNSDGHVIKFNILTNETEIILTNTTFINFNVAKYSISPDLKYVLFAYDVKQVYRHSYMASYSIYNVHTREVWELDPPEVINSVLQYAAWGVQGQQLIYVFENNIYYQSDVKSNSLRLTSSGKEGVIFNGIADWLYEEEILQTHVAHWWSPDGERLAFLVLNDSLVPNMALPRFTGMVYPKGKQYPYPKAGQANPVVKLYVVNLYGPTHTLELMPPETLKLREHYVTMVKWISKTKTSVRWLNRAQNISILTVCDTTTGACVTRHEESSDLWLSKQNQEPVFSKDGSRFFLTVPVKQGGRGEFHHIAMFTTQFRADQNEVRHLTSGNWEVTKIIAYDENSDNLYFLSTEGSSRRRQLYSVKTVGLFPRRCLTCELNKAHCLYFDADISPTDQHIILYCKGPGAPTVILHSLNNSNYYILENNSVLKAALKYKRIQLTDFRTVPVEHFDLPLKISYPPDFSDSRHYGLLLLVDSAPGGQAVSDRFSLSWDSVLVSSDNIIVARLDGRGSGFQGQRILHEVHQRLGTVDVQDQISAVDYMMKFPYIDRTRIAVFGRGYGAYITLMMLKSTDILFKCACAMSPVTDWKLYASAFSERYLGMPLRDDSRYQFSSVLQNIQALREQTLMLVHGTADANIHFQHSAELVKSLVKVGANYSMQIYPDEGHFLSLQSHQHLYATLTSFYRECLKEELLPLPDEDGEEEE